MSYWQRPTRHRSYPKDSQGCALRIWNSDHPRHICSLAPKWSHRGIYIPQLKFSILVFLIMASLKNWSWPPPPRATIWDNTVLTFILYYTKYYLWPVTNFDDIQKLGYLLSQIILLFHALLFEWCYFVLAGITGELYYIRQGIVNHYALTFNIPLKPDVNDIYFNWENVKQPTQSLADYHEVCLLTWC